MHRMHVNKRHAQMQEWTQSSFNERGKKFKKKGGVVGGREGVHKEGRWVSQWIQVDVVS